jgi:hypothetical protein
MSRYYDALGIVDYDDYTKIIPVHNIHFKYRKTEDPENRDSDIIKSATSAQCVGRKAKDTPDARHYLRVERRT